MLNGTSLLYCDRDLYFFIFIHTLAELNDIIFWNVVFNRAITRRIQLVSHD